MSRSWVLAATVMASLGATEAAAQDWRTFRSFREYTGEEELRVEVTYLAGELRIGPAEDGTLFRTNLRYDPELFEPDIRYERERLVVRIAGEGGFEARRSSEGSLDLALGRETPLSLDLTFGAGEGDIELGGLPIRRAEISTGASATEIRFSSPNPIRASTLTVKGGAAELRVLGLGNANADRIEVGGGVGEITLDFTGTWQTSSEVEVDVGLAQLNLVLPTDLGVRIDRESLLARFDAARMVKRDGALVSENWDASSQRLTIHLDAALASVDVRWVSASTRSH
ncbi:MAG TPA: hypothetical protein VK837_10170 [Longimicrobiales bacterium]|nr:hypothetical protein [Longimicrobiales bacterium]